LRAKIGNQHLHYGIGVEPKELNTSDTTLSVKHAVKYEPITGTFETTNGMKYGSPSIGPARLWATLDHIWDNKGKSNLKPSLNV